MKVVLIIYLAIFGLLLLLLLFGSLFKWSSKLTWRSFFTSFLYFAFWPITLVVALIIAIILKKRQKDEEKHPKDTRKREPL